MDPAEEARQRWMALLLRRETSSKKESDALAPAEHGAWAELRVREHPLYGPVEQLFAIPGYTAVKGLGFMRNERTAPPTLEELAEAYRGLGRGVRDNLKDLLR